MSVPVLQAMQDKGHKDRLGGRQHGVETGSTTFWSETLGKSLNLSKPLLPHL